MTPEDQIKQYTISEFAERIRKRYPQYKDLGDNDLTDRILKKHPEYKSRINFGTVEQAEASVAKARTQFEAARNAYTSAGGQILNPAATGGTDYFRPLTTTEKAAQKRGEPVIISSTQPQTAPVAPEMPSRPRKMTEPPVSLAPVVQSRLEAIQKQNRQKEIQQKVQQARQVRERAQGLVLPKGQRNQGAAYQPKFGLGQTYREIPKIDKTIPNVAEMLAGTVAEKPLTFEQDRAIRVETKREMERLKGRAGAASDFQGEEYQNFLRLNRTFDSPKMREDFLTLKAKQRIAEHGSITGAILAEDEEAARRQRVAQMGNLEYAAQLPKGPLLGVASGAGTALKGLAVAAKKILSADAAFGASVLPGAAAKPLEKLQQDIEAFDTQDTAVYQLGEFIEKNSRSLLRSNPDLEKEFFVGKAPEALGQSALFLLGGWASKSPKLAISILGGTMTAGDAYEEVRSLGGTDEEAVNAGLLAGAILGPTELIGTRGLVKALEGTVQASALKTALKQALVAGSKEGVENAVQEIGQEAGQGLITGNPRSLAELAEAGALGGIAGLVGTGTTTLGAAGIDALRNRGSNIVSDYLAASPLSTPEERTAINLETRAQRAGLVEQASVPDQKPQARAEIPSISEVTVEKPQQIQPDQISKQRTAKTENIIPETIRAVPTTKPAVETPAEVETQPSAQPKTATLEERMRQEAIDQWLLEHPDQMTEEDKARIRQSAIDRFLRAHPEQAQPSATESQLPQVKEAKDVTQESVTKPPDVGGKPVSPTVSDEQLAGELESVDFYRRQGYDDIAEETLDLLESKFGPRPAITARRKAGTESEKTTSLAARVRDLNSQADAAYFETAKVRQGEPEFEQVMSRHQSVLADLRTAKEALVAQWKAKGTIKGSDLIEAADDPLREDYRESGIKPDDTFELRDINVTDLKGYGRPITDAAKTRAAKKAAITPGPIVVTSDNEIVDGFNRAHEALQRGDKTIEAWVAKARPELIKVKEVADISPSNEEAKRATILAKPTETKPVTEALADWGTRLKTIAQSKDLNALQVLSDEMAAHKDDPRVARLRTAIQDELAKARESEIQNKPEPRRMNFTQFATSRGYPSDYDVLEHGRLGESGRMSKRLRQTLSKQHLERARANDQAHREFAEAIRRGEIVDTEELASRRVTKEGLERSELEAKQKEIKSQIASIDSQIQTIENLGSMSHLPNGKLKKPYQRTVDQYNEKRLALESELKEVERGQAKPEDTQASMFARGEAQKPSEFAVEGNRVSLNLQGAEILTELYEEASQAGQTKGRLRGTFERKGEALARNLDKLAARGREGAKELANAVRQAVKAGNGKVVLFYGESAKKHELFHEASDKANQLMSERHADLPGLINTDTFRTMSDRLIAMGYPGSNLPLLVEEAAAHIAEGRYDQLGITREQAVEWMYKWFQSFEKANPNVNPREFQEMSDEATQARDEVYRTESALREPLPNEALPSVQERRESGDRESIAAAREPREITQTEAFKRWFGDSKVVDEDGKPLVVYHGTSDPTFDKFKRWGGLGHWFGSTPRIAEQFAKQRYAGQGPAIYPVYLSISNPMVYHGWSDFVGAVKAITKSESIQDKQTSLRRSLMRRGYDGVVIRESDTDRGGLRDDWVAFKPEQIKSATGNRGTFDPNDPNILMARSGEEEGYQGEHAPADAESGAPLHDLTANSIYPDDVYGPNGLRFYPTGYDALDREAYSLLQSYRDHPGRVITIYRAVPKDVKGGIRAGDWVTPIRGYAKEHGKDNLGGDYKIQKKLVFARDLYTDGNSWLEWGYDPQPFNAQAEKDARERRRSRARGESPLFARSGDPWANLTELSDEFGRLANEPELAPGEKPLSLPRTLEDAGLEAGPTRGYLPESIVDDGVERAKQVISEKGIDGAIEFVKTGDGIEWASTGYEVSARLREEESKLRAEGKAEEADKTRDKRLTFLDDFAFAAAERGRSVVGIKAISIYAPDRMAFNLTRVSRKGRKKGISDKEEANITDIGDRLGELEIRNAELEKRLADMTARAKQRTGTKSKPKKTDYQSKLEQQASTVLQTLKPKLGKLDLSGLTKESERGAVKVGIPALPGDAELIAQYAAAQLSKQDTVQDLNQHLVQEFGQDIEQHLPKIRQRAYAIRQEARLAEIEASDTEPKRRKTILSEIQKEISESLTAIREAQKTQDRALKAEKAAQVKSERAEARLEARRARERATEEQKEVIKEARRRLKQQRAEYKQASQAETKGYRETIRAQREAERRAELWDTPLRNAAAEARKRLKDAIDPQDPQTADDLIAVAAEKFLPTEIGGNPRTGAVDPSRVYKDLKDEFPKLVTKKNQGDLYKQGYQRIQDATAAAREAARMRSASAESKRLWDELGIDVDAQAVLIQQAEVRRQTDELRRKAQAEFQRVSRTMVEKIWMEAQAIPRSLQSSIDAPIGRQGAYFLLTHPLETIKTAVPATLKGYGSIHVSDYIAREKELAQHPDYKLAVNSGLELSQTTGEGDPALVAEEQFQSSLASRFLPHVRLSEQGYVLGMNAQRLAMFSRLADTGRAEGYTPETNPEFFEAVAQFVNDGTGRGTLPDALKRASALLNFFFFSTRLNVSRIQLLNDLFNPLPYIPERLNPTRAVPGIGSYDPAMRKVMGKELLRLGLSISTVLLLSAAMGIKVEFDPDDPDGLLLRIRNTRYDITGGEAGTIKFLYRLMKSIYRTAAGEELEPFEQPLEIAKRFTRYKLAPLPSGTIDALTGKDAVGQPANLTKFESPKQVIQENVIVRRVLPMLTGNIIDTVSQEGWIGVPMVLPALAGFGVSSYPDRGIRAIKNQAVVDLLESLKITSNSLLGQKTKDEALDKVIQARIMEKVETLDIPQGATEVGKEKLVKERLAQIRNLARAEAAIAEPKLYADYLKSKEGSESVSVLTDEEKKTLTAQDLTKYREIYAGAYVEMLQRASQAPNWSKLTDDEKEKVLARIPRIAHNRAKIDLVKSKRKP